MDIQPPSFFTPIDSSKIQSSTDSYPQAFIHYQNLSFALEHILKKHPQRSNEFMLEFQASHDSEFLLLSATNTQFKIPLHSLPLTLQNQIKAQSSFLLSLDDALAALSTSDPASFTTPSLHLSSLSQTLLQFSQLSTPPRSKLNQLSSEWPSQLSDLSSFISQIRHSLSHLPASFGLGYESYISQHPNPTPQALSHFLQVQPGVDLDRVTSQQIFFESQKMIHWRGDLSPGFPMELHLGYHQPHDPPIPSGFLSKDASSNTTSSLGWVRLSLSLPSLGPLVIFAHQYHNNNTVFIKFFSSSEHHLLIKTIYQQSFSSVLSNAIFEIEPLSSIPGGFYETP